MALLVVTDNPKRLLQSIKRDIDQKKITTWTYDKDGDLVHIPEQWKGKAWFRPETMGDTLIFGLLGRKNVTMTRPIYAAYHGHFADTLLYHFDGNFKNLSITALGSKFDNFKAKKLNCS